MKLLIRILDFYNSFWNHKIEHPFAKSIHKNMSWGQNKNYFSFCGTGRVRFFLNDVARLCNLQCYWSDIEDISSYNSILSHFHKGMQYKVKIRPYSTTDYLEYRQRVFFVTRTKFLLPIHSLFLQTKAKGNYFREVVLFYWKKLTKVKWET